MPNGYQTLEREIPVLKEGSLCLLGGESWKGKIFARHMGKAQPLMTPLFFCVRGTSIEPRDRVVRKHHILPFFHSAYRLPDRGIWAYTSRDGDIYLWTNFLPQSIDKYYIFHLYNWLMPARTVSLIYREKFLSEYKDAVLFSFIYSWSCCWVSSENKE